MELKKYVCTEVPEIRVHGRISNRKTKGIPLFWVASAIEFNTTSNEVWLEYTCIGDAYLRVEIDGYDMYRFPIESGTHKVCILRAFKKNTAKNIRIFREAPPLSNILITMDALYMDGEFEPLPERQYKIEFFGDSVTSGEGLGGDTCHTEWMPAIFSCRGNYALLVAKEFDADWSLVSQSGWGIFTDSKNNRTHAIPNLYNYVYAPTCPPDAEELGASDMFDIENDKTNITVINLGGNDSSAFGEEQPWTDENGVTHKLKRPDDLGLITDAVYNFCANIRKRNKETIILVCHNMLTDALDPQIIEGAEKFKRETGDDKVYTVCLPRTRPELKGARYHPGPKAHALFAGAIINKLKEIL